jgi:DNA-binding NtrC family response regulator
VRVLIVDDEPLIRWALAETLEQAGHEVQEAGDALGTHAALRNGAAPDVVLLDFRLPDSDDLNLLRSIRQLAPGSAVIMMTAFSAAGMVAEAEHLGAFCVLTKPVDMSALPSLIDRAVAARK